MPELQQDGVSMSPPPGLEELLRANLKKAVETFETISEEDRADLKKALSILEEQG